MGAQRFLVEAGHIMMFARAIGDNNPAYVNLSAGQDVIAPPTFTMASAQFDPDYSLRPNFHQPWMGSAKEATGVVRQVEDTGTGLHAEQHFTYHRPIRAGDVLRAESRSGKTWEKDGRRGGKLRFSERIVDYFDSQDELVVTARSVGVRTERTPGETAS
ncbi:FAS1-like dehydratase domain-containing protein [Jatrophihabitans sp. DSM 45814]